MLMKPHWPTDAFEQWWQHYPRRVAKKFAHRVFERLRSSGEVPFECLLSATQNYARSVVGKDMKFVAHPATWLNAGRWDDAPDALLDVKVPASILSGQAFAGREGLVLIKRGSPQAWAWERHRGWAPSGDWYANSEYPSEAE